MKKETSDTFYKAILARDHRFDGKFFIGVKTTGVYCRPICPAKPKRENLEFFSSALLAEKAGYRPCLRCRPECAPLSPGWQGTSATVRRALQLIANGTISSMNESQFAELLGVSSRHLQRLFKKEINQTPKQVFINQRLNFARQLIVETQIPMTEIAYTSDFQSIRRFNDAVKKRFHRSPTEMRKKKGKHSVQTDINITLPYRPPYDWESTLRFYQSHQLYNLEKTENNTYERIFKIGQSLGVISVSALPETNALNLNIVLNDYRHLFEIVQNARQMFDINADPLVIANALEKNSTLKKLIKKYPGLRLARGWDPFETAVCTILGQLVSIKQANNLITQLIKGYGKTVKHPITSEKHTLFPDIKILASSDLNLVKTTQRRKECIRTLAQLVIDQKLSLQSTQPPEEVKKNLCQINGIGEWSAEYIKLRALGDSDAFPASDLILKRALDLHPHIKLESMKPWRSYAALYLWKEYALKLSKTKG